MFDSDARLVGNAEQRCPGPHSGLHRIFLNNPVLKLKQWFHGTSSSTLTRWASSPRQALRGGISKVNSRQVCQLLAMISRKNGATAPRTCLGYPHEGPFVEIDWDRARPSTLELYHARLFVGLFRSQFSNVFQETGALLGQKLTKAHQWLQERT